MKWEIRAICAINAHKILAAPIIIGMMYWSTTGVRKPFFTQDYTFRGIPLDPSPDGDVIHREFQPD